MTDYVFPHGPFKGRNASSLSDAELAFGLSSCPREEPFTESSRILRDQRTVRNQQAEQEARKRRNREARQQRKQQGTAPRTRVTADDYLAQATPLERAQYDAAADAKQRRIAVERIKRRIKREAEHARVEAENAEHRARQAAYEAQRQTFMDAYHKQHPDADTWTVNAAWRNAEPGNETSPFRERTNGVDHELAVKIIEAGRRVLAQKAHPDVGGDPTTMVALNATKDWLTNLLQLYR